MKKKAYTFRKAIYEDLKVGTIFTWSSFIDADKPADNRYKVTEDYNPQTKTISFETYDTSVRDRWVGYKVSPTMSKSVFIIEYLSKEEMLIEKIKYLDKRYSERNKNVSSMA